MAVHAGMRLEHREVSPVIGPMVPPTDERYSSVSVSSLQCGFLMVAATGTIGLVLYSTIPFLTTRKYYREFPTLLFEVPYVSGD